MKVGTIRLGASNVKLYSWHDSRRCKRLFYWLTAFPLSTTSCWNNVRVNLLTSCQLGIICWCTLTSLAQKTVWQQKIIQAQGHEFKSKGCQKLLIEGCIEDSHKKEWESCFKLVSDCSTFGRVVTSHTGGPGFATAVMTDEKKRQK